MSSTELFETASSPASSSRWVDGLRVTLARPGVRLALTGLLMWGIYFVFLALVQFSTSDLPDNDGYYHIKLAYLMRTEGLKPDFPYLPLSVLNPRDYSDHHYLFHIGLIPFTFGDLRLGAKWASVFYASLAFLSVWWLLARQKVRFAALWALGLLAISEAFIFRMSITRTQSLSLAVLVLGLAFLLERRYWLMAPLGFLFVWLYNAFPLIFGLVGVYMAAELLLERRLVWQPLVYALAGVFLGVVINPYFPQNAIFLYQHLAPKLSGATAVQVGSEWYPYDTGQLLENSPVSLIVFMAGILALGLQTRRFETRTASAFFMTALFGLMLFQSRRFIEYFPPFALIFAAFAWSPVLEAIRLGQFYTLVERREDRLAQDRLRQGGQIHRWVPGAGSILSILVMVLILVPGIWLTYQGARDSIATSKPYTLFEGASRWLSENTLEGERIFQTDWDDFPRLYFYNTYNTYLIGLDPTYMQRYDPELYDRWVEITRGEVERPGQIIVDEFAARYVVSDRLHDDFIRQAEADPRMVEVYQDELSVVYLVNP